METTAMPGEPGTGSPAAEPLRLLFVSEVCFVREALAAALEHDPSIASIRCADPAEVIALNLTAQMGAVLVHTGLRDGPAVAARLREVAPGAAIIACALHESDDDVITWAEAWVDGYIPDTVGLDQFVSVVKN
ncbi:MAG TPA: hypothetical protein VNF04_18615, partial [Stellaceae bacterium]|nr:hypothetical protein [Stellaceae bacterium]